MSDDSDSSSTEQEPKEKRIFENVLISPDRIIFDDPFEGKYFESYLVIQNVGASPKFIRILPPTSSNIKMKAAKQGIFLPPGMKVRRKITYTVVMATLVKTFVIPIFINDKYVAYKCEVRMAKVVFQIVPPVVDFGLIDAGPITSKQKIKIINNGKSPSKYSIDLGLNELNIQVDPSKGVVMENSSVTLSVELNAWKEGKYSSEFWVIADSPICVKVYVEVTLGCLECVSANALKRFTFLKFPPIYYGTKSIKSIMMLNTSQLPSMFCVTAESENLSVEKIDCGGFSVSPSAGRFPANDRRPFIFTFEPRVEKNKHKKKLILMKIHKIHCKDIGMVDYSEPIYRSTGETEVKDYSGSICSMTSDGFVLSSDFVEDEIKEDEDGVPTEIVSKHISVILFGETEHASISIIPNEILIEKPIMGETLVRTLILANGSKILPIYYKYVKVAFVHVEPKTGYLRAGGSEEVTVRITPESCTDIDELVRFELLFHDVPRFEGDLKVIGEASVRVRFQAVFPSKSRRRDFVTANSFSFDKGNPQPNKKALALLKKESAMLALPDERPQSLKPWKDPRRCRTIYSAIPRKTEIMDEYMYSKEEADSRNFNKSYYNNYLRIVRSAELMNPDKKCSSTEIFKRLDAGCVSKVYKKRPEKILADFLPLTPMELFNIEIEPRDAFIEGIVSRSSFPTEISVTNRNESSIRVYLRPQKMQSFYFPDGDRMIIGPKSTKSITYLFYAEASGIRTNMIDVIVNENHVFVASITVKVSPAVLDLSPTDITFEQNGPSYKCLEISNSLNAPIEFIWDFCGDFQVEPLEYSVDPGKKVTCCIYFEAGKCASNNYELQIRMDGRRLKSVRVRVERINFKLVITGNVDFGKVGCNVGKTVTQKLENKSNDDVEFKFTNDQLLEGVTITPMSGVVPRKGFLIIRFSVKIRNEGKFQCETVLNYARFFFKTINITGEVEFPRITFTPNPVKFRKMAASSFDIKCVTITNHSDALAVINFDPSQFPEIHYSEYYDSDFLKGNEYFEITPKSQKVFSMHFYPFYPATNTLHLPILINGMDHTIDKSCPKLKGYATTLSHRIIINNWKYKFEYFPNHPQKSHTDETIDIQVSENTSFCIRLDELKAPFSFDYVSGGKITEYSHSIVVELKPGENVTFNIGFHPESTGSYVVKLPVFVKDDHIEDMHNYFYLKGDFLPPLFEFNPDTVYFGLIPFNTVVTREVEITMKYHQPHCTVETFVDNYNVTLEMMRPRGRRSSKIKVIVFFSANSTTAVNTSAKFICSCGVTSLLKCVGGADNNILTIYSYIMFYDTMYDITPQSHKSNTITKVDSKSSMFTSVLEGSITIQQPRYETTFPFFPSEDNAHTQYMNTLVTSIEEWLFLQIFHAATYYKIPETICVCERSKIFVKKKKSEANMTFHIPFYDILRYYNGSNLETVISIKVAEHGNSRMWMLENYENMLQFLRQLGALLPHVKAQYLLEYDGYAEFMKIRFPKHEVLTPEKFHLLSKQCWLDLILQTFKLFYYQKISTEHVKSSCNLRKNLMCSIQSGLIAHKNPNNNVYSFDCSLYMAWINKTLIEPSWKKFVSARVGNEGKERSVDNFTSDVNDCVAFCAATMKYCPFFASYFEGMHVEPVSREEYLHNACILVKVWEMLDISFKLTPRDLVDKNPVLMQMLLSYLYEFLSHLYPMDTLHLVADLGKEISDSITVSNDNTTTIKFNVSIFNDPDGVFSHAPTITVSPGNSNKLKLFYHAKYIRKHNATLILNGETYTTAFFTNSKVYNLIAEPNLGEPTVSRVIRAVVYEQKSFEIMIQSPFKTEATYELFFTIDKPENISSIKLTSYSPFIRNKLLSKAYMDSFQYKSNSKGEVVLRGMICPITSGEKKYWCFLRSVIGDFYCEIICVTEPNIKEAIPINVQVEPDAFKAACVCRHQVPDVENVGCPKNIKISIPTNNYTMWRSVIDLFTKDADEKEKFFWMEHQDTEVGPILLKKILECRKECVSPAMSYIFKEVIKYKISGPGKAVVSHPSTITIDTNLNTVVTTIHLNSDARTIMLTLKSEDGLETRRYKINLL